MDRDLKIKIRSWNTSRKDKAFSIAISEVKSNYYLFFRGHKLDLRLNVWFNSGIICLFGIWLGVNIDTSINVFLMITLYKGYFFTSFFIFKLKGFDLVIGTKHHMWMGRGPLFYGKSRVKKPWSTAVIPNQCAAWIYLMSRDENDHFFATKHLSAFIHLCQWHLVTDRTFKSIINWHRRYLRHLCLVVCCEFFRM